MTDQTKRLTRKEACDYLLNEHGVSRKPSTLAAYATKGGGPEMEYDGRFPLYSPEALDRWVEERLSPPVSSFAEKKALRQAAA